jgi:hypothetical protein
MPYEPRPDCEKSGRVLIRMPISMHEHLAEIAGAEGVSMNQFICGVLAVAIDWRREVREPYKPIEEIRRDLVHQAWLDRLGRGEVKTPG